MNTTFLPYIVPFAAFLILTYAGTGIPRGAYWLYPIKTLVVGGLLLYYRKSYAELRWKFSRRTLAEAVAVGIIVFIVWVAPDRWYPHLGSSEFDPYTFGRNWLAAVLIAFRLIGAVLVVPMFEELFWRSFALRWLIKEEFIEVPIGAFSWFSCIAVVLAFGVEHHQWLVGLLAGIAYNALLYRTKNLSACVLAHAVTNLLLGVYVLWTHQWNFW